MNTLYWLMILDSIGFQSLHILLSTVWQSSIIFGVISLLAYALRHKKETVRYSLWLAAVFVIPLLPFLTWSATKIGTPQRELSVMPEYTIPREKVVQLPFESDVKQYPTTGFQETSTVINRISLADYPWALMFTGYSTIALLFVLSVIISRSRINRWITSSNAVMDPRVVEAFLKTKNRLGMKRDIIIMENEFTKAPLTCRTLHPVIILPTGFSYTISNAELHAIAVHELSHIKHNDMLILTLVSLVRAVFFFHPMIWFASREILFLAESYCDSTVLDVTREELSYTNMLTRIARNLPERLLSPNLAAGLFLSKSMFYRRIKSILTDYPEHIRKLSQRSLAGTVLAVVLSVATALAFPLVEAKESRYQLTTISGKVIHEDKSIEGATVYLYQPSTSFRPSARVIEVQKTKRDGSFNCRVQPFDLSIVTYNPSYALDWTDLKHETNFENITIELTRPRTISGTVKNQEGYPLSGVEVSITSGGITRFIPELITKTDSRGLFTITNLPEGTSVNLEIISPGYSREIKKGVLAGSRDIEFIMMPEGCIEGSVIYTTSGKSVKKVQVFARSLSDRYFLSESVETKRDGSYHLTNLKAGMYTLQVIPDEKHEEWTAAPFENVEVKTGQTTAIENIKLIRGAVITGKITEKGSGGPIENVRINCYRPDMIPQIFAVKNTDRHGFFSIRVPPGKYELLPMLPPEYEYIHPLKLTKKVTIQKEKTVSNVNYQFERGIEITGHALSPNGDSVQGVTITPVYPTSTTELETDLAWFGTTLSGSDGVFTLSGVTEGKTISVNAEHKGLKLHGKGNMKAQHGVEMVINLEQYKTTDIEGRVTDEEGNPLAGVTIKLGRSIENQGWRVAPVSITDISGKFRIPDLITGKKYRLWAEAKEYTRVEIPLPPLTIAMPPLENTILHEGRWINGTIRDLSGTVLVGATLTINGGPSGYKTAVTNTEGYYQLEGLVPDVERGISVYHKNFGHYYFRNLTTDEIHDFTLLKPNRHLTGCVVDSDNNPVAGADISKRPQRHESGYMFISSKTDAHGKFNLSFVDEDSVTISVYHKEKGYKKFENMRTNQNDITLVLK